MGEIQLPRILIVEDEVKILENLSQTLAEEGFSSQPCTSFQELESILESPDNKYEVIILDRLLHGRDSAALVSQMKMQFPECHVMVLSAINTSAEKASLLDLGADDYLSKPFDPSELIARVKALLRRNRNEIRFANVKLDLINRTMHVDGQEVSLPNREFLLLRTLIQTPGKVFNKNQLYQQVWEMSTEVESHVIEATVNKIRKKISEAGAKLQIKNTRNIGYWIEE